MPVPLVSAYAGMPSARWFRYSALSALLRRPFGAPGQVFAVGHEKNGVVRIAKWLERCQGAFERASEIRLAARRGVRFGPFDRLQQKRGVGCERTERYGGLSECDERGSVAAQLRH